MNRDLRELAREAGVQLGYVGHAGRRVRARTEPVMAVLRSLGHDVRRPEDARESLARERARKRERVCEAVVVGRARERTITPGGARESTAVCARATVEVDDRVVELERLGGGRFELPAGLAPGAYALRVDRGGRLGEGTLLVAPRACFRRSAREMGVFLALHAARPAPGAGLGIATYGDLGAMARWSAGVGAGLFGTLPLLATFLDEPFDPSPYAPVSRERWSELYVDPRATEEWRRDPPVREWLAGEGVRREAAELARADEVDYRRVWELAWGALGRLADAAFASDARRREIEAAADRDPELVRYAAFRAWCRRQGSGWSGWREGMPRELTREWRSHADVRAFVYGQLEADRQLRRAQAGAAASGGGLYLDLAVGASADGFDTFAAPETFLGGLRVGAPPDAFFTRGQDWGFRPPDPLAGREAGHAPFRRMLRAHMERCSALRIDHVMMLHRLFCIPEGGEPADGVYLRYPSEELYASLAIESQQCGTVVVGENLGIVPREVNRALRTWGVLGMRVGQFEIDPGGEEVLPRAGGGDLACLNTHDLPPWAAFWTGADIDLHVRLGLMEAEEAEAARAERTAMRGAVREALGLARGGDPARDAAEALDAVQGHLAGGEASVVLVSLEDMWGETLPQNVPGIGREAYPCWRRRVRASAADFTEDEGLCARLRRLGERRGVKGERPAREEAMAR